MSYDWVVNRFTYSQQTGQDTLTGNTYVLIPLTLEGTAYPQGNDELWQHKEDQPMYIRSVRGSVDWFLRGNFSDVNTQGAWITLRLTIMKMDPINGEIYEPPTNGYNIGLVPNANDEFLWEERIRVQNLAGWTVPTSSSGGPVWNVPVNWKGNRKLERLEQLVLVCDNETDDGMSPITFSCQRWLRTLLQTRD